MTFYSWTGSKGMDCVEWLLLYQYWLRGDDLIHMAQ